jgi:LmbE family N-acetylglucosaminyl deacetylase
MLVALYIAAPYLIKSRFNEAGVGEQRKGVDAQAVMLDRHAYMGVDTLPENGIILFVTAHPDDLEFMAGGTLPRLLERGNKVYLAILADGGKERYMPTFYSRRIIKTRHDDQLKISKAERLAGTFFINYKDGYLQESYQKDKKQAVDKVQKIATEIGATDIFTFESGGREGYHDTDHATAGKIGTEVAKNNKAIGGLYYFRAQKPNVVINTTDTFNRKMETLFLFTEMRFKHRMMRAMHEAWDGSTGRLINAAFAEGFYITPLHGKAIKVPTSEEKISAGTTVEATSTTKTRDKVGAN